MKQYIDRNALLEELRNDLKEDPNIYNFHIEKEIRDSKYEFAIEIIEEAPIVDIHAPIHDILFDLTQLREDYKSEPNSGFIDMCIDIVKEREQHEHNISQKRNRDCRREN